MSRSMSRKQEFLLSAMGQTESRRPARVFDRRATPLFCRVGATITATQVHATSGSDKSDEHGPSVYDCSTATLCQVLTRCACTT
jgi:hypothetical protein